MIVITPEVTDRFLKRVAKGASPGDCWQWIGTKVNGKGRYGVRGFRQTYATSLSLLIFKGIEVRRGNRIKQLCGDRGCVNPDHLVVGAIKQSMERNRAVDDIEARTTVSTQFTPCDECLEFATHEQCQQANLRWMALPIPEFREPDKFDHRPYSDRRIALIKH